MYLLLNIAKIAKFRYLWWWVCLTQLQSVNKNGRFFYVVTIKYLCRLCGKRKNVTFFLLDVLLHPN